MAHKTIPVKVALRIRPLIPRELDDGCQSCIRSVPGETQVILGQDRAFTYDYVFGQSDTQSELYDKVSKELIDSIYKGINATILAYGQTGSGKTFTMGGCYESSLSGDETDMGIIPRVLNDIFRGCEEREGTEFSIGVSYMEIYNEEVFDLLCATNQRFPLSIKEEANGGIKITGLKEVRVNGYKETMALLSSGSVGRTTGATAMNSTSSRSHAVFTLHMEQRNKTDENDVVTMKFQLVDLAGSERCKRTGAEGDRFKEGVNINKGLLVLGNVISALGKKQQHIPYRDAKLTRILQDSLGGNSHTVMIACVSPADTNIEETLNTLRYADRARKIKNKPIINRDPQAAEVMRLRLLVQQLQSQLMGGSAGLESSSSSSVVVPSVIDTSAEEIRKLKEENQWCKEENLRLTHELHESLQQRTQMMDNVLKMEARLESLKDNAGIDVNLLSSSLNAEDNPKVKAELEKIFKVMETIKDEDDEEDSSSPDDDDDVQKENEDVGDDTWPDKSLMMNLNDHAKAKEHLLRQADLHRQLSEMTSMLKEKENRAKKMNQADEEMMSLKLKYEEMVSDKQREIDDLKNTQNSTKNNVTKLSEKRRQKLQQLEGEIQELKKKMEEKNRILKLKQKSETHVTKLNSEVQTMKQQRVRLMKQMKEEAASFQKWKREKEKEVCKLKQKDSKREFQLKKLQTEFDKQQNVLKRKNAEAIAANKRLKDALSKRSEIEAEKTKKLEKCDSSSIGNRVRKWLGHELDLKFSMAECKFHLEELIENRRNLTQRLQMLSNQLEEGPLMDKFSWLGDAGDPEDIGLREEEIKKQMKTIQMDIDMINMQITELQQKIVETDQDLKGTSTWQSLHTMTEAKCALKFLLEQAVNAKAEHSRTTSELRNIVDHSKSEEGEKDSKMRVLETTVRDLKSVMSQTKNKHEREVAKLTHECEEKVLFLLSADQSTNGTPKGTPKGTSKKSELIAREKIKILESQVKKFEETKARLQEAETLLQLKDKECESLKRNMTCSMYKDKQFNLFPDVNSNSSPFLNPTPKRTAKKCSNDEEMTSLDSTFTLEEESETTKATQQSSSPLFPPPPCPGTVTISKPKISRFTRSNSGLNIVNENESMVNNTSTTTDSPHDNSSNTSIDYENAGLMKRKSGNETVSLESNQERKKRRKRTLLSTDIVSNFNDNFTDKSF